MFNLKTLVRILINTIIGVILVFIWSRFVDLKQILDTISQAHFIYLLPTFVFMFLSPFLRAIRLHIFLAEIKKIPLWDLFFLNGAAQFINFFIPIRMGELAKGVYLNTRYNLHMGKAIIWIFLDRFVDFLTVLILTAILFFFIPTNLPQNFIISLSAVLAVALVLTYLAVFNSDFSKKLVKFLTPLLIEKHIKIYFSRFSNFILDSFSILKRHPKDLSLMGALTVLAYGADAGIWYFTFKALESNQSILKMYLGQILSALTYLIPAAPGYVGSAEASGTLILTGIFGIELNLASAMIVLFHITTAVFMIILGLISIFNLKLDLGLIFKKAFRK